MRQTPSRRAVRGGGAGRAHTVTRSMQMIESISGTGPIIPCARTCQEWLSYLVGRARTPTEYWATRTAKFTMMGWVGGWVGR